MEIQFLDIINVLTTTVAGLTGWFVGRKKQKNDFLNDLQASIDLLAAKNRELMEEVIKLREENAALRTEWESLDRKYKQVLKELKKSGI